MAGEVTLLAKIDIFGKDKGYSSIVQKIEKGWGLGSCYLSFILIPSKSLFFFSLI